MITITLQKIRDASPCESGWAKVLKAHKHLGMDTEFPLASVLDSNDLDDTLWCLGCLPEHDNLWRKFAVWCARQVQHLMKDERSIAALDVAWRHSNGEATDEELRAAEAAAWDAARAAAGAAAWDAARAARAAAWDAARAAERAAAWAADASRNAQRTKLLQILTAGEWVED